LRAPLLSNRWSIPVPLSRLNLRRIPRSDVPGWQRSGEVACITAGRSGTEGPPPNVRLTINAGSKTPRAGRVLNGTWGVLQKCAS
jgi:hypothetical protein